MAEQQKDAAIDAVNDCYNALYDAQEAAQAICRNVKGDAYIEHLARSIRGLLREAENQLSELGDALDSNEDEDDDEEV